MAGPPKTRLPRGAKTAFLVLVVLGGLNFADQGILIPFTPHIQKEFNLTETQVGVLGSSFIAVIGVFLLFWGYLADRYSRKNLLLLGSFLWAITAYGVTLVRTYEELLVMRALGGIGVGSFFPVAFSMTADLFRPGQRGKAAGALFLLPAIGAIVGGIGAGVLGIQYGWRIPFQAIGSMGLGATAVFWFLMKEPPRAQTEPEFKDLIGQGQSYVYRVRFSDWKILYREKANLFLILQGVPGTVPWGVLFFWAIFYLQKYKGFPLIPSFVYLAGFFGGTFLGNIIGGFLGDRLARKGIQWRVPLCIAGIVGGMALVILTLLRDIPALPKEAGFADSASPDEVFRFVDYVWGHWEFLSPSLLLFAAGILSTLTGPNWFAVMQDINLPEIRGSVSAVNNIMSQVGSGIGPILGGVLADALGGGTGGLRTALIVSSLFWIPCAAFWVPLWWHLPRAEKRARETLAARASESKPSS